MATLGGHVIHVITEDPSYSVNITQHPVESGIDLTDHVERKPTTMALTGMILGPEASDIRDQLIEAMMAGTPLDYFGRNAFRSALLARFDTTHDKDVANGYRFVATLQQVRVAQPSYAPLMNDPILLTEAKDTTNAGRQQLADQPPPGSEQLHEMRRGETLYSIAPKYGTTWQQLLALNPGVDPTKLQIGEQVRIA